MPITVEERLYNIFYNRIMDMNITKKNRFYKRDKEDIEYYLNHYLVYRSSIFNEADIDFVEEFIKTFQRALEILSPAEFQNFTKLYFSDKTP